LNAPSEFDEWRVATGETNIAKRNLAPIAVKYQRLEVVGRIGCSVPEIVESPIASHPQRHRREAEEKGQDRQGVEQSPTKDCEGTMSHQMEIVSKADPQSSAAGLRVHIRDSDRA
jgi:hypothetical protein